MTMIYHLLKEKDHTRTKDTKQGNASDCPNAMARRASGRNFPAATRQEIWDSPDIGYLLPSVLSCNEPCLRVCKNITI